MGEARLGILALVGALTLPGGCHGDGAASPTTPSPVDGAPRLGAHALAYYRVNRSSGNASPISTPAMATQPSGSTMVLSVGRGLISAFEPPSDNKGNGPYAHLAGNPLTSRRVTTTGPALLVAFWWGDASGMEDQTRSPATASCLWTPS